MAHGEQHTPVISKLYERQLSSIALGAKAIGLLVAGAGLVGVAVLGFRAHTGPLLWWSLFLVLYGGCIVKASEAPKGQ